MVVIVLGSGVKLSSKKVVKTFHFWPLSPTGGGVALAWSCIRILLRWFGFNETGARPFYLKKIKIKISTFYAGHMDMLPRLLKTKDNHINTRIAGSVYTTLVC